MNAKMALIPVSASLLAGCNLMDLLGFPAPPQLRSEPAVYTLGGINTAYDEYNPASLPEPFQVDSYFVYASNAASQGAHFDIHLGKLHFEQQPYRGTSSDPPPKPMIASEDLHSFMPSTLTTHHETGPVLLKTLDVPLIRQELTQELLSSALTYVLTSDRAGQRDLYFVDSQGGLQPFFGNDPKADDAYLTYDTLRQDLYFSSARSGKLQLYRYRHRLKTSDFKQWLGLSELAAQIEPVAELASDGNDTCPLIVGDRMFFASDRPGGKGGYDLYMSRIGSNGRWGKPENLQTVFSANIALNTAADEFRPGLFSPESELQQELLIFSSNRPGGKGGYDLYLGVLPPSTRATPSTSG